MASLRTTGPAPRATRLSWAATRRVTRLVHHAFQRHAPQPCDVEQLELDLPGRTLQARIYRPQQAAPPAPGLIYFHGGGYTLCDLDTHDPLCRWLAGLAGATVVSVAYRLAPEHRFPAQTDDARDAALWVLDRLPDLDLNPARVAIGGDSAGGFLAAHAAVEVNRLRPGALKIQLLIYPLLHVNEAACAAERSRLFRFIGRRAAVTIGGHVLEDGADPLALTDDDVTDAPPTLIVSGGLDPIRAEAQAYAGALQAVGCPVEHLRFAYLHHGGLSFPGLLRSNDAALMRVGEALGRLLG